MKERFLVSALMDLWYSNEGDEELISVLLEKNVQYDTGCRRKGADNTWQDSAN
jgi:hypothetical protein